MVLDQVRLKDEGLSLAVGDDEFNLTDLACHQPDPWRQIVAAAEMLRTRLRNAFDLPT